MNLSKNYFLFIFIAILVKQQAQAEFNTQSLDKKINIGILSLNPVSKDKKDKLESSWSIWQNLVELFSDPNIKAIIISDTSDFINKDNLICDNYSYASAIAHDIYDLKKIYNKPVYYLHDKQVIQGHEYLLSCSADSICTLTNSSIDALCNTIKIKKEYKNNIAQGLKTNILATSEIKYSFSKKQPMTETQQEYLENLNDSINIELIADIKKLRPQFVFSKENFQLTSSIDLLEKKMIDNVMDDQVALIEYILSKLGYNLKNDLSSVNFIVKDITENSKDDKNKINSNNANNINKDSVSKDSINETNKKNLNDKNNILPSNKYSIDIIEINAFSNSSWNYFKKLYTIFSSPKTLGIILSINCPGGCMTKYPTIHSQIIKLKKLFNKPVVGLVDTGAFSCGYMISTACDHIIASPLSLLGNIGVRWIFQDLTEKNIKENIEHVFISPKNLINMDEDIVFDKTKTNIVTNLMKMQYNQFKSLVKNYRPRIDKDESKWDQAKIFTASQALEVGLADSIGTKLDAIKYILKVESIKPHEIDFNIYNINNEMN